jgi:hypothetical protein
MQIPRGLRDHRSAVVKKKTRAVPFGMTVWLPWPKAMRARTATLGEVDRLYGLVVRARHAVPLRIT